MKRREFFFTPLGGVAASPLAARAQQTGKLPIIGFLAPSMFPAWTAAFVGRLKELGWIDGQTVAIEQRIAAFAVEFVRDKVDVIVGFGSAIAAFKRATSTIPIVFAVATDPVSTGLVASLPRPGGNVTGLSSEGAYTAGKRLEVLHEVLPNLRRGWPGRARAMT